MITLLLSEPQKLSHALSVAIKTLGYVVDGFSCDEERNREDLIYIRAAISELKSFSSDLSSLGVFK